MDKILIFEDFVRRWGSRFTSLLKGNVPQGTINTSSEFKDWSDAAKTISSDPVASHRLAAMTFEKGVLTTRAAFTFTAPDANTLLQNIEDRRLLLAKPDLTSRNRVLMRFTRTEIHDAKINKKSADRVVIRELSTRECAVMYASEMVEAEIRDSIREAVDNVYKKGFVVDVMEHVEGDKIVAYSIVALHSVIDLDD